ncbi:MAG: hypothetical protein R3Y46_02960 [Opitutales bacterium]
MFKRLLLCLAFAICSTLWGDSVAVQGEDAFSGKLVLENVHTKKNTFLLEYPRRAPNMGNSKYYESLYYYIINGWTQVDNIDLLDRKTSIDVFIEIEGGAPVPHNIVEIAKKSISDKAIVCNTVEFFEYAMFLSLYYLGFPKEIMGKFTVNLGYSSNKFEIFDADAFPERGDLRDLDKAIYYADKAVELLNKPLLMTDYSPVVYYRKSLFFEGIGNKEEVEKYHKELIDFYKRVPVYKTERRRIGSYLSYIMLHKNINKKVLKREYQYSGAYLRAYVYYYGHRDIEKNLEKAKYYAELTPISFWKNFYFGFCVPKDKDFAKFLLQTINTIDAQKILADIEAGVYEKKAK